MGIFKIGLLGAKELTIEEAEDARAACWKAGWDPDKCQAQDITEELAEAKRNGIYVLYEVRTALDRMRQIENIFAEISREAAEKRPTR